jgi:hypothetical protein
VKIRDLFILPGTGLAKPCKVLFILQIAAAFCIIKNPEKCRNLHKKETNLIPVNMKNKIATHLYVKEAKKDKTGVAPIYLRITVNGEGDKLF